MTKDGKAEEVSDCGALAVRLMRHTLTYASEELLSIYTRAESFYVLLLPVVVAATYPIVGACVSRYLLMMPKSSRSTIASSLRWGASIEKIVVV